MLPRDSKGNPLSCETYPFLLALGYLASLRHVYELIFVSPQYQLLQLYRRKKGLALS